MKLNTCLPPPALLSQEREALDAAESSGPSESEVALQEALNALHQEKDALTAQYQAQVHLKVTPIDLFFQRSFLRVEVSIISLCYIPPTPAAAR